MAPASELRSAPRYRSESRAEVEHLPEGTAGRTPRRPGRILNVSATGVQLSVAVPTLRGERIRVRFPRRDGPAGFAEADLWVAWSRPNPVGPAGQYICGAEYDPPGQPAAQQVLYHHRGLPVA